LNFEKFGCSSIEECEVLILYNITSEGASHASASLHLDLLNKIKRKKLYQIIVPKGCAVLMVCCRIYVLVCGHKILL
jgi:hypothetical protein